MTLNDMESIYNLKLADPESVREWRGLENREIYINFEINDFLMNLCLEIINWNREDEQLNLPIEERIPIKVYINSDGGELPAVMNFIDVINVSKTPIYTIGMGKCYSSGGLLLLSGHKRFIFPNTIFLLHDGYMGDFNSTGKALDRAKFTEKSEEMLKDYIISKTKITQKAYNEKYRQDWYMSADEMIELGIADEIVTDIKQIL